MEYATTLKMVNNLKKLLILLLQPCLEAISSYFIQFDIVIRNSVSISMLFLLIDLEEINIDIFLQLAKDKLCTEY